MQGNKDTIARINRVLDYIEEHKGDSLTLNELAEVAHLSPYHFHRIFSVTMGESLGKFVQRIRLNWAAGKLTSNPETPITQIAFDTGFSSSAAFAHAFKQQWGMSAKEWRTRFPLGSNLDQELRKNEHMRSKSPVEWESKILPSSSVPFTQRWRVSMKEQSTITADVTVRDIDPIPVAYVRHVGPYAGDGALFERLFGRLYQWAGPRDLINAETMAFSIYHDSPEVVEEDKLRTSCCISVPEGTKGEGDVGTMTLAGGRYAVAYFEIDPSQYGQVWEAVYAGWLPDSGYTPDDRPAFEKYIGQPGEGPEGKHCVEIWLPVKPA